MEKQLSQENKLIRCQSLPYIGDKIKEKVQLSFVLACATIWNHVKLPRVQDMYRAVKWERRSVKYTITQQYKSQYESQY
jgi:hypothetical protein